MRLAAASEDLWYVAIVLSHLSWNFTFAGWHLQPGHVLAMQLISLIYGEGFHIFKPDVPVDDEYRGRCHEPKLEHRKRILLTI